MSDEPQYIQDFLAEHGLTSFDQVVNGLRGTLDSSLEQSSWDAIDAHLRKAVQAYSYVYPLLTPDRSRRLRDVYVPIPLEYHAGLLEDPHAHDFCTKEVRAVILGHAGAGKSTLIQNLLMSAIAGGAKIPIFLRLRQLHSPDADGSACLYEQPEDSLVAQACGFSLAQDGPLSNDDLHTLLKNGRFLFLLDGYDEAGMRARPLVNRLLARLKDYPHCSAVMTSRPEAYDKVWMGMDIQYQVSGIAKESALELIEKSDFHIDPEKKSRFLELLTDQYFDTHHSFASNPLLLSLMYMSFSQHGQIPDRLFDFYEDAFDVLWEKHDLRKEGVFTRQRHSQLERSPFLKVLEHLCIKLQVRHKGEEPQEEFSSNELDEMLDQARTDSKVQFEIPAFREDLYQGMHLLLKEGLSTYRFIHRSFRDYFSARYLINCTEEERRRIGRILIKRINSDQVLSLLGDTSPELLEDDILLPHVQHCIQEMGSGTVEATYAIYLDRAVSSAYVFKKCFAIELNTGFIERLSRLRAFLIDYMQPSSSEELSPTSDGRDSAKNDPGNELLEELCIGIGKDVKTVVSDSLDHAVEFPNFSKTIRTRQDLQPPIAKAWEELSFQWFWDTWLLMNRLRERCMQRDHDLQPLPAPGDIALHQVEISSSSVPVRETAAHRNARAIWKLFTQCEMKNKDFRDVTGWSEGTVLGALHELKKQGKIRSNGETGRNASWIRLDLEQ